ncbi:lysis system i-spanin subunit Rz [Pseudomonas fluorescens]|uniref:lysis system i-spanin subunit Rz n=1 Tax=Pseudomonas fluorescens TaxID=294 RepID=UPI000641E16E|nr:lysis system i-spanin subunit Rz [Pseudomonas fluorescens]
MNRYLLIALAACAVAILFGWQYIERQADQLATAQDQVNTLTKAAESRRNTQRLLAQLDTEHTKALTDAQIANNQLRTAVATGAHRLSVKATCPAVRDAAGAARVDDAEARAELDPASAERIVATANDGDDAIRTLTALQDYVSRVCLKGN